MFCKKSPCKFKVKFFASIVLIVLAINLAFVNKASATIPTFTTGDATATAVATKNWLSDAWTYIRNKMATIMFQNILRKVLNDFAKDAAKYVASGGQGQEATYVKQKWGNFWQNVGDKATGDFIESFANSVISDYAAKEIRDEKDTACTGTYNKCLENGAKSEDACYKDYTSCMRGVDTEMAQEYCDLDLSDCADKCDQSSDPETCADTCQTLYDSCAKSAQTNALEKKRQAPLFKGSNSPLAKINICHPNLAVDIKIGLGLKETNTGYNPDCSFSTMVKNWKTEYDKIRDMTKGDYLKKLSRKFDPQSNDLSVAFSLHSNLIEYRGKQVDYSEKEVIAKKGWLDVRNVAGDLVGTPGEAEERKKLAEQALWDNIGKVSGDILVDAANIFLNQLAISGWQNLMENINETDKSSVGLTKYWNKSSSARQAIENKISKLTEPVFSEPGKMNILAELSTCPSPDNPGPTECVIPSTFSDAITSKMTVIEAVRSGRLPGDWPFGFTKLGEDKLQYNQGYPYRSMLILRKYRVLPVGWEVAAQEIQREYLNDLAGGGKSPKTLSNDRPNGITLNDLLSCFSDSDDIDNGYKADWCRGLVDPNWVLKLPDYYCGAKGYGPQIQSGPTPIDSGVKFCSTNNGLSRVKVDGEEKECTIDTDCCTDDETVEKENLLKKGDAKKYKEFECTAKCTYKEKILQVIRSGDYCADEQSCLKYGTNGNCLFYGYCSEERRSWSFSRNNKDVKCEPYANTCQSFKSEDDKTKTFLANTLDYAQCNANNVGCKKYSVFGSYVANEDKIYWNANKSINLNKNAQSCKKTDESCHEFVRIADSTGSNLLPDGDFELNDSTRWNASGEIVSGSTANAKVYAGTYALHVPSTKRGLYYDTSSTANKSLLVDGFEFELDNKYTLSAFVWVVSGRVEMSIGNKANLDNAEVVESTETGQWEQFVLTVDNNVALNSDFISLKGADPGTEFYVDSVKFEVGNATQFSPYAQANLTYLKFLPWYLESVCYKNPPKDYTLKDDAPAACQKFVRRCQKEEVGCELYTDVKTKDQTAAKVKAKDVCPKECVGFDTFIQKENNFYSQKEEHFIPSTAKTCGANAAGCSLLVNLDTVPAGGENDEYYSQIRHCVKKDNTCGEFYTWEGSAQTGYATVVYQLQTNSKTPNLKQPLTYDDDDDTDDHDGDVCNEAVYSLPSDHPDYNPDCRQFYGKDGKVSYHLYSKTVTCSDNCHPYRLVANNVDQSIDDSATCSSVTNGFQNGNWNSQTKECTVCKQGAVWNDQHKACIYMAIPGEGRKCGKEEAGCSEYTGNFGSKVRIVFNDTFESGKGNWNSGVGANGPEVTSEALNQGGHSIHTTSNFLQRDIRNQIRIGKKYELSFMAKTKKQEDVISSIRFLHENVSEPETTFTDKLLIDSEWRQYKFVIDGLTRDDIDTINISFTANNASNVYLDNLKLLEYDDHYYLIKDSWQTPDSCNKDHNGNPYPLYMLGCREYTDRANKQHFFRSFSSLCQLSGVGCEMMIDTYNSQDPNRRIYNDSNKNGTCDEDGCVDVPADKIAYVVYDDKKTCYAQQKGCQRMGLYGLDDGSYTDTYMINNPDTYPTAMCKKEDVGCSEWMTDDSGSVYFKDPGNRICEYRQKSGTQDFGWLKKKNAYCKSDQECTQDSDCTGGDICREFDAGGTKYCSPKAICTSNNSCGGKMDCKLRNIDEACDLDKYKTIGLGVIDEKVQPVGMTTNGYAGACLPQQVGCTEYIDPNSVINYNQAARYTSGQGFDLVPDKLYIIKAANASGANEVTLTCNGSDALYVLNDSNYLVPSTQKSGSKAAVKVATATENGKTINFSEEFMVSATSDNVSASTRKVRCTVTGNLGELKEAIVAYRIKSSIDKDTKPTEVSLEKGAVLFNERAWISGKPQSLTYSSAVSGSSGAPQSTGIKPPGNNANQLLQVDADRECSAWLGCKSYGVNPMKKDEKLCYERALCNQMNEAGECVNFVDAPDGEQTYAASAANTSEMLARISNLSGYAKAGYYGNLFNADYYNLGAMHEIGDSKVKFDGSFENTYDSGFFSSQAKLGTDESNVPVLKDAAIVEKELGLGSYKGIPDGQALAKASGGVVKEVPNVQGADYVISAYVYLRFGSVANLTVGSVNLNDTGSSCKILNETGQTNCATVGGANMSWAKIGETKEAGRWVRLSGRFRIASSYVTTENLGGTNIRTANKLRVGVWSDGLVYFDDVRIEPALQVRSDTYLHPSCRLFPEGGSVGCDYYTSSGVRKKGWEGYCLEWDPRNSQTCLLWYPLDKVESEEFEEGAALDIANDLYYCIDAEDQCRADSPVEPEFFCRKFLRVDRSKYWYSRINSGSGYKLPASILTTNSQRLLPQGFSADFGVDVNVKSGGVTKFDITQDLGNGYYGAYSSRRSLGDQRLSVGMVGSAKNKKIFPFVPWYGLSYGGLPVNDSRRSESRICKATIDTDGRDNPIVLGNDNGSGSDVDAEIGTYDGCFVKKVAQHADPSCGGSGLNKCCNWNVESGGCGDDLDHERSCRWDDSSYMCGRVSCAEGDESSSCTNGGGRQGPDPFNTTSQPYTWKQFGGGEPDTRCNVWRSTTDPKKDGKFLIRATDTSADQDAVVCLFDCYYYTKGYNVADDSGRAIKGVNRLFANLDDTQGCYQWYDERKEYGLCDTATNNLINGTNGNNGNFKTFQTYSECSGGQRNENNTTGDADLCWVRPKVDNIKTGLPLDGNYYVLHGRGWVQLTFNSHVDKEQLPLRRYTVFWGYTGKDGTPYALSRTANMFERPDINNPHVVYHFYDYDFIDANSKNKSSCPGMSGSIMITPSVQISDNWDKYNGTYGTSMDKSICILPD